MTQCFQIHPDNPQPRLIARAVEIIRQGGVIAYPTDSAYALGCHIGDKTALDRIRQIRKLDKNHNFTLVCRDLTEIATYAYVDNIAFRLLKSHTPGPYTFILKASRDVPRRLLHPKRKSIGLRVPDNNICQELLQMLNEPIMSVTLILPGEEMPIVALDDVREQLEKQVDLIIDGGNCGIEATSVIDLQQSPPEIIRVGKGDISDFE